MIGATGKGTRYGPNRVAADIQRNGGADFLVKTGLRFRIELRFWMNLCHKPHMIPCLFWLHRPSLGQIWLKV